MSDVNRTQIGSWQRSQYFEKLWPEDRLLLWQMDAKDEKSKIVWSGQRDVDYRNLADLYYDAGYKIADEIIQSGHDNLKTGTWLLADFFMFRQAIELILKSKIYSLVSSFNQVQAIFTHQQHDINRLLKTVLDLGGIQLDDEKVNWLKKYICDVEFWDAQSTLFRYPFKARFFKQNPPRSVDVYWTAEKLSIAYALLRGTCPDAEQYLYQSDQLPEPVFFSDVRTGYPVCYFREDAFTGTYFSVIQAYVSVSEFLLTDGESRRGFKTKLDFNFPAVFSMRHVLELSLKQLAVSKFSKIQALNLKNRINTHRIYTDLWKKLEPVIAKDSGTLPSEGLEHNVGQFIENFQNIDCKGDFFRYPTEYNQQYHQLDHEIDLMNLFRCVRAVANLLDACDGLFDDYARYEAEAWRC